MHVYSKLYFSSIPSQINPQVKILALSLPYTPGSTPSLIAHPNANTSEFDVLSIVPDLRQIHVSPSEIF